MVFLKRTLFLFVVVLTAWSCQESSIIQQFDNQRDDVVKDGEFTAIPNQYIVVFKQDVIPQSKFKVDMNYQERVDVVKGLASEIVQEVTGTPANISHGYHTALQGFAAEMSKEMAVKLSNDPRVLSVEEDKIVQLAPPPGRGKPGDGGDGGTSDPPQETPWGITRVNGGGTYSGDGKAWIIDTGVDLDHPDLNVDQGKSKSFLGGGKKNNTPDDQNGHGTHVAGTVAAIDNSIGVIGVAAGATVVSVRVLDRSGSGTISGVIAGVDYVAQNAGADDVANMSLGGGASSSLDNAVISASSACPFSLAAGNSAAHASNHSPARANGSDIYTISAMNSNDVFASFSNYGNPPVDYCEPGVSILSCWKNGGYNTISGTSMAAPHAAGLILMGGISGGGNVSGDPDGNPDTIGVL